MKQSAKDIAKDKAKCSGMVGAMVTNQQWRIGRNRLNNAVTLEREAERVYVIKHGPFAGFVFKPKEAN